MELDPERPRVLTLKKEAGEMRSCSVEIQELCC